MTSDHYILLNKLISICLHSDNRPLYLVKHVDSICLHIHFQRYLVCLASHTSINHTFVVGRNRDSFVDIHLCRSHLVFYFPTSFLLSSYLNIICLGLSLLWCPYFDFGPSSFPLPMFLSRVSRLHPSLLAGLNIAQRWIGNICPICKFDVNEMSASPSYENITLPLSKLMHLHYETSHPESLIPCPRAPECDERFVRHQVMKNHYQRVHLLSAFKCQFCPRNFARAIGLRFHLDEKHPEKVEATLTFKCQTIGCGAAYSCRTNLSTHIRKVHEPRPPVQNPLQACDTCGKIVRNLKSHQVAIHGDPGKRLPCPVCGRSFPFRRELTNHWRKHHPEVPLPNVDGTMGQERPKSGPVPCPDCGKVYPDRQRMRRHLEIVHEKIRHPCPLCERSYVLRSDMKNHVKAFHRGIKARCRVCGAEFGRNADRNRHEKKIHPEFMAEFEGEERSGDGGGGVMKDGVIDDSVINGSRPVVGVGDGPMELGDVGEDNAFNEYERRLYASVTMTR